MSAYTAPAWEGITPTNCNVVLEGGAMRSQFTAGVTDFWMERKFFPQTIVGTSAGALTGVNYAAGQLGRTCLLSIKYANDSRFLSYKSFIKTGNVFNREFAFGTVPYTEVPLNIDDFNRSPITLFAVSSNIETGEADYHLIADYEQDLPYLIASSSLPLLSQPVEVDGKVLLDGGNCDSIPVAFSQQLGQKKQVVVLTQCATYEMRPNKLMPLMRSVYSKYPRFCDRAEHRFLEYNQTRSALHTAHARGDIFVIEPPGPVTVGHIEHSVDKLMNLYEQGYEQAMLSWKALQEYLEK